MNPWMSHADLVAVEQNRTCAERRNYWESVARIACGSDLDTDRADLAAAMAPTTRWTATTGGAK